MSSSANTSGLTKEWIENAKKRNGITPEWIENQKKVSGITQEWVDNEKKGLLMFMIHINHAAKLARKDCLDDKKLILKRKVEKEQKIEKCEREYIKQLIRKLQRLNLVEMVIYSK